MRVATLNYEDDTTGVIIVSADGARYWPAHEVFPGFAGSLSELIDDHSDLSALPEVNGCGQVLDRQCLASPIRPRRSIFCVGKNYSAHAEEFNRSGFDNSSQVDIPYAPVVFTKEASTVIGNGAMVPNHRTVTSQLDYEAELAVVIGRRGVNITREDAYDYVWGYTIINDVTARDLQKKHKQWFLGKSLDGFCPMGPWIVTADEINPDGLLVTSWVNGEVRQSASTNQLIFSIPELIETISAGIELQPGDVIATGTPAGVGIGFTPPKFLKTGDIVRIEISDIGALENSIG